MIGSFCWRAILKLLPTFKAHTRCKAGRGDTLLFWSDKWLNMLVNTQFPELHSFAITANITLAEAQQYEDLSTMFHRPLSLQAYNQFNALHNILTTRAEITNRDSWIMADNTHKFSAMTIYIKPWLALVMLMRSFRRFGKWHVGSRTKFSFGFCCMTG